MSIINCKVKYIRPKYDNLKKWMDDSNNVYIGRSGVVFIDKERYPKKASIFANPYKITPNTTREEVLERYKYYIIEKISNDKNYAIELLKLKGKNLGCWCYPEPCHGNVLLKLIEKLEFCIKLKYYIILNEDIRGFKRIK